MNALAIASAPAPQVRTLDVLWQEAVALKPSKFSIETPGFLTGGKIEVTLRFNLTGTESSLRLAAQADDVRVALENVLAQAAQLGRRP